MLSGVLLLSLYAQLSFWIPTTQKTEFHVNQDEEEGRLDDSNDG